MSEELREQFEEAAQGVLELSKPPDDLVKLQLYALYKQAQEGDCKGKRPSAFNVVARAKHDSWKTLVGTSQEAAMRQYIDLVNALKEADEQGNERDAEDRARSAEEEPGKDEPERDE